jgi:hypothetical protein
MFESLKSLIAPGKLIEMHGSEEAPIQSIVHSLIKEEQACGNLICYVDGAGRTTSSDDIDLAKIWYVFNIEVLGIPAAISEMADRCDLLIIDDITFYQGDIWRAIESLSHIARRQNMCIIVINQRRNVLNHATREYEDRPYRLEAMKRYCNAIVDMDTGNIEKLDTEIEYDPFVQQLIGRKVG